MLKKEKINDTFIKLKKVIYVEKDKEGNIIFPNESDSIKKYREILRSKITDGSNQFYHKDSKTWYQILKKTVVDEETNQKYILEFLEDITDIKKEEHKLKIDALTNLINDRNESNKLIEDYLNYAKDKKEEFSIFMGDLDDFKLINDTYGHNAGDVVLSEVGKLLRKTTKQTRDQFDFRKSDIAIRIGGDEFLLLFKNMDLQSTLEKQRELKSEVEKLIVNYGGIQIPVSMSFGYYHVSKNMLEEQEDMNGLRTKISKKADEFLYDRKKMKKNLSIEKKEMK